MKRTELRRVPMRRVSRLVRVGQPRKTAMKAVSAKRRRENVERRRNVLAAFGTDPMCFVPDCGRPAVDAHELLSRARGGSITDVSGIRPVCRVCHNRITTEPAWAESLGYALPSPSRRPHPRFDVGSGPDLPGFEDGDGCGEGVGVGELEDPLSADAEHVGDFVGADEVVHESDATRQLTRAARQETLDTRQEAVTRETKMQVTMVDNGSGTPEVHKSGCRDLSMPKYRNANMSAMVATSILDLAADWFADIIGDNEGDAADYVECLVVFPCVKVVLS